MEKHLSSSGSLPLETNGNITDMFQTICSLQVFQGGHSR